jgi:mannose-6-phosphate isomerase-like protein (cupin superfamily)
MMNMLKSALIGLAVSGIVMLASAGLSAAQQASSEKVEFYPHAEVAAAFAKGATLAQGKSGGAIYQVLTAHRDGPGEVEIHTLDTDIVFVVKGTATFVTGGTPIGAKHTAPNELRGKSIQGGTPHHLAPEDIIIIPHGVPHWFEAVRPPFQYLVIKVR